jgi:HEAT repeat protein
VRQAFHTFFGEVEALRRAVEADGARLGLVAFPFRGEMSEKAPPPTVQEEIASFCRERGLGFVDLLAPLREVGASAFSDHVHLTAQGTARVADALAGSGLFPEGPIRPDPGVVPVGGRPPDVPALLSMLKAPAAEDRAAAARALGHAGRDADDDSVPAMTQALLDPSPRGVRAEARRTLRTGLRAAH